MRWILLIGVPDDTGGGIPQRRFTQAMFMILVSAIAAAAVAAVMGW